MDFILTFLVIIWFISIIYGLYSLCRWGIDYYHGYKSSHYELKFWISLIIFIILLCLFSYIGSKEDNREEKSASYKNRISRERISKRDKKEEMAKKINRHRLHKEHEKKLEAKLSHYPHIQDQLQSMSNNKLFMTESMVKGKVISWGATAGGAGQILLKDSNGNKFMIEPSSNKGLKGIDDGAVIAAYGSNFDKQKINSSQTNTGIDPSYQGDSVINMPTPDYVKIMSGKGDV